MSATDLHARPSTDFEGKLAGSRALLVRAAAEFSPLTQASSLGAEDVVLTHLNNTLELGIPIFVLDTGMLHPQTLELLERTRPTSRAKVNVYRPVQESIVTFVQREGNEAMYKSIELRKACCHIRKVEPLERALAGQKAWITGLRQAAHVIPVQAAHVIPVQAARVIPAQAGIQSTPEALDPRLRGDDRRSVDPRLRGDDEAERGGDHDSALSFITCGSVDDSKSTLIGRLLVDSKAVLQDQLAGLQRAGATDLALLTDGLSGEHEQGITIDVAYRYFATPGRKFIIGDAPGHEQYTRNMVTAASTADAAVVLVDATKLEWRKPDLELLRQTRRHSLLVNLLRVPAIVFTIDKLDAVDDPAAAFRNISNALNAFARAAKIESRAGSRPPCPSSARACGLAGAGGHGQPQDR